MKASILGALTGGLVYFVCTSDWVFALVGAAGAIGIAYIAEWVVS